MINELNVNQVANNANDEISKGFPHFWIFIIPIDLTYFNNISYFSDEETNLNGVNLDISVNIGLNYLIDDFINIIDKNSLISSDEDSLNYLKINNNDVYNSLKFLNRQNVENTSIKGILKDKPIKDNTCLIEKEGKKVKIEEIINSTNFVNNCKNKPLEDTDFTLSKIQNFSFQQY